MSDIRVGDLVRVEYEGTVAETAGTAVWVSRSFGPTSTRSMLRVADCTVLRPALKVGDTVTADTPEPPVGTVMTRDGFTAEIYVRVSASEWAGTYGKPTWNNIHYGMTQHGDTYTVLRVGGEG